MVQATACRAVIYGFNSHPQLLIGTLCSRVILLSFSEKFSARDAEMFRLISDHRDFQLRSECIAKRTTIGT